MQLRLDMESDSEEKRENDTTINDLATAFFVRDLRRALGMMGCTPQCIEDSGVCEPIDVAHEFVTTGPCFEKVESDLSQQAIPTRIEVMLEGDHETVMTTNMHFDNAQASTYESFADIEDSQHCARAAFLAKCLQPKK